MAGDEVRTYVLRPRTAHRAVDIAHVLLQPTNAPDADFEIDSKILPVEMASDPERLDRFRREAKALAALDHPSIVTVFSVEETEGAHFLTMQLVEGETLERLLPEGGLSLSNGSSASLCRSPMDSLRRTSAASSIATSSPRTSWSPATGGSRSSTSGSRRWGQLAPSGGFRACD